MSGQFCTLAMFFSELAMSGGQQRNGMGVFLESGSPASNSPPELRYSGWHKHSGKSSGTASFTHCEKTENPPLEKSSSGNPSIKILFSGVWYSGELWFASPSPPSCTCCSSALQRQCLPMIPLFQRRRGHSLFNKHSLFRDPFCSLDLYFLFGVTISWKHLTLNVFGTVVIICPIQATSCGCRVWPGCRCSHVSLHTSVRGSGG